ncbi:anthranilate synthase component II [Vampirovibrio chlorellavorus]|uniref:anthranilate synthase component II n=1 Tax=Vampirovibrio chlorellavorus TaxID=758823 RepID=UPI0026ECF0A4|nr:aminodeoxychorismate/anthranilate synthase component II [Vampirovibrio chlorellavorus]
MSLLILDNFDSFTYNLYQMVQARTSLPVQVYRNNELDWEAVKTLSPQGILISPGPGHPSRPQDFGICKTVIERQQELNCPILGVCLGHQGLVYTMGGQVVPAPQIMHGKTSAVRIVKNHPLLTGLPNPFTVMRYHSWMVETTSLPADWEVLAETEPTPTEPTPLLMAVAHRERPLYGVQFHPESVGTPEGGQLLRNFIRLTNGLSGSSDT